MVQHLITQVFYPQCLSYNTVQWLSNIKQGCFKYDMDILVLLTTDETFYLY